MSYSTLYQEYSGVNGRIKLTQFTNIEQYIYYSDSDLVNHNVIFNNNSFVDTTILNNLSVGDVLPFWKFSNGNEFLIRRASEDKLNIGFKINGSISYPFNFSQGAIWLSNYISHITIANNGNGKLFICLFQKNINNEWTATSLGGTDSNQDVYVHGLIDENIPIDYNWISWPQLSGNAGMFLMNLSTIADELIGDGETPYETFDPAGFNIISQSELYPLVLNLLNGQESKIVFCGDNYITATRRSTFVNDVLTVYVTLKFYFRSDTLIYTSPELTIYSDNTEISRDYLSIMYDDDQEVAATNIIQIWASGKYGINEYALPSDEQMRALYIWLQDNGAYRERVSPYDTGTTDNGGNPGVPAPQDHITDTDFPTLSGLNNGIVTLYRPTEAQLSQISAFLWSDNVLDNFKKYFNNFADNLLNLYILPYIPAGLNTKTFKVGNMTSDITDVEFCTQRFYDIDMGSVNIEKLWDCYLDFAPYTKLEIYLPYLGMHSLDIDEFMCPTKMDGTLQRGLGSVLSLTYRLDILTGVIVAKVKLNGDVRYQFEGRVGATIPLTGQTYASMVQGIVTAGAGLISTIATGGLTAPMSAAAAVAGTVNAAKPSVERVGNISGDASMLCTNEPYIVISRPNKPELINQARYTGFPSYKTDTIGNFEGFTQVIDAHIDGISCTEEERAMILSLLKEGVIL